MMLEQASEAVSAEEVDEYRQIINEEMEQAAQKESEISEQLIEMILQSDDLSSRSAILEVRAGEWLLCAERVLTVCLARALCVPGDLYSVHDQCFVLGLCFVGVLVVYAYV